MRRVLPLAVGAVLLVFGTMVLAGCHERGMHYYRDDVVVRERYVGPPVVVRGRGDFRHGPRERHFGGRRRGGHRH